MELQERMRASWKRGCDFLGVPLAILGGAMSWLSERHLVAAISEAGGFGVLAGGSMMPDRLQEEIRATRALTGRPFGVNLITMHPELPALLDMVVAEGVGHCVLAGGVPSRDSIRRLKEGGVKVLGFSPALSLARLLVRHGVDALILEGHEAGGHVGPVATSVLVQEILPHIPEVPVFVAGGIADGGMVAGMVAMGAAGCQVGTRFVCTDECVAHERFKQAFIRANARDAVVTVQFDDVLPVIPVRAMANKGTHEFNALQLKLIQEVRAGLKEKRDAQLELEHFWVGALRRAAIDGDVEHGSVMMGQSVGLVKRIQPVKEVLEELTQPL
ncbi:MAG: nitronate monooxygenase, partial [Magnetococcales bacterium]|nr:nitronate monooxygenase [Magnetococcales bacterium]